MATAAAVSSKIGPAVSSPLHTVATRMVAVNPDPPSTSTTLARTHPTSSPSMASSPTSSRSPPPPASTTRSKHSVSVEIIPPSTESAPKTFKRLLRSPFDQTLRSATRSKGKSSNSAAPLPAGDHFATVTAKDDGHGGKRDTEVNVTEVVAREATAGKDKERTGMLKRFETKVAFRRTRKESGTESSTKAPIVPPSYNPNRGSEDLDSHTQDRLPEPPGKDQLRFRLAGFTSFATPSLRLASMSSPALHLSSHASSSPTPASPSSSSSPNRPIISSPAPLTPKRASVGNANSPASSPSRHRKSRPDPLLPSSPSTPSFDRFTNTPSPGPSTPTRPGSREPLSPPGTPTPTASRSQLGKRSSSGTTRFSQDQPPSSPSASRPKSPSSPRTRAPPSPRVVTPRGFTSTSTSSLNYPPSYSSNAIRRSSIDRRSPSPALPRASSPSTPSRPRALSPGSHHHPQQQHQRAVSPSSAMTRHTNASTSSLSPAGPSNPLHREAVRTATSVLCREMLRPGQGASLGIRESEEVECRMRALARLERVWVRSGVSTNGSTTQLGGLSLSANMAGEERERRMFTEALRDGYVLCQLMNKLRPGSIARIDPREDGKLRTSNVTKFLASCSANGLPPEDLFLRDDLIEGTSDCLARVAKTINALVKWAETPVPTHSHILRGGGSRLQPINTSLANAAPGSPYRTGSSSRAIMSSPNLSSPPSPLSPTRNTSRHRSPPPAGLPTLRSHSPDDAASSSDAGTALGTDTDGRQTPTGTTSDRDEVPPILAPRSPVRSRPSERSLLTSAGGDSFLAPSLNESARMSVADSTTGQSIASSNVTDTSTYSSLLDAGFGLGFSAGRSGSGSGPYGKFGTIRTVTTEATSFIPSEWPSLTRTEGSAMASSMLGCEDTLAGDVANSIYGNNSPNGHGGIQRRRGSLESPTLRPRERKPSETVPVDLTRVIEESEELLNSNVAPITGSTDRAGRMERINLGKGKWPDDFVDALQAPSRPIAIRKPSPSSLALSADARLFQGEFGAADLGVSASINSSAGAISASTSPPGGSVESLLQGSSLPTATIAPPLAAAAAAAAARRPTHRARHSVDAPVLAPKDASALLRRDSSPDTASLGLGPSPGRVALRRNSTRGGRGSGTYVPRRSSPDDGGSGGDGDSLVPIPFPRAISGEYGGALSSSPFGTPSQSQSPSFDPVERAPSNERGASPSAGNVNSPSSLLPRGRFQSEVDGASSRRRPRPNSYDEFGPKPRRSRFESMVNLGVASGEQASASDLMARDATEGSVSRQTLVVREEGKAPTHFQLGNCIGRGQFGAVYRALNLNTGQMVAVKRIGLEGLKEEEIAQLMREVDLVKRLSHPSIVKYEGMARDENTLSIVLEYAENGSLGQTLKAFGKLNEKLVASYVFKILEGLDYLHRSDVVHCDLKAANILTTKTGNVKLSDFGVSLNLRAMEREIKDVAGTPNWMAPEVIELKGASPKSDIWSLGCTVIELLTGRPPYGDIGNAMTVMFRIVEDESPPIPERFSGPLVAFLKECFHKDPSMRPSAEQLFEHEWLKNHWGLNKDLRPQDSIPFLRRVSADLQKNGAARHLMANLELDSPIPVYAGQQFDGDMGMLSSSPGHRSFTGSASPVLPEVPQSEADLFEIREHTFVKTTFSKPVNCRVCMEPAKKGALCSHCSLIAHSKCAGRAALTCDLRSKLLMHAQFAERGSSPAEFFPRLPNHHPASASSSRGSLDRDRDQRERERTNSPQLSPTSSPHPPIAYKVLSPFNKRSRASLTPDPTHSNSSVSLAGAMPSQAKVTSVIPEGNVIRRKLSIILTRQREPQQVNNTHLRERPQSISSIGSSCATSPQSPASQSPQSNSLRSLQAVVAATGNSSSASSASRAARVDPSAATTASSFVDAAVDVADASCVTVPDTAAPTVASRDKKRMMTMTRRARGDSSKASNGGNCSIQ
ncbi:Pkinase-domain-containing protein [Lactarius indigo]|nr:Pkinase-domain-containing protein [Lactarius indigo]